MDKAKKLQIINGNNFHLRDNLEKLQIYKFLRPSRNPLIRVFSLSKLKLYFVLTQAQGREPLQPESADHVGFVARPPQLGGSAPWTAALTSASTIPKKDHRQPYLV